VTMQLFPFQAEAVIKLTPIGSALIGDDMGLGKTHEAIALDLARRAQFPQLKLKTLIVCPLAMVSSWTKAWFQWSPDLRILPINNKDRSYFLDALYDDFHDVYICHWPVLRLLPELKDVKWFHIIADEAHAIQNRKSKQSEHLKAIPTGYKTALTGTPAFDKPDDLWSILNWLYPRVWSSYWAYFNNHIMFSNLNGYRTILGVNNPEKLQADMSHFYVRRRKEEVLKDLPEKYYTEVRVDLHDKQRRAYNSMKNDMLAWIGQQEHLPVVAPVVIAQLTRLQQFACAFAEWDEDKQKMFLSEPSSKLDAVMEIIESTNQQVVVFSQFAQVIKLLAARLEKKGITCGKFIGATPAYERSKIISDFQDGKIQVFAGTIAAGGVGITLTAASTVIFTDRSWSNALNLQAEDRLHRIGQKSAVQVIDIIADGTIDAKRIKVIQQKWSWIKRLIGDTKSDPEPEDVNASSVDYLDDEYELDDDM
jgi:SNF2 family DNA or RNA helicase